MTQTGKAVTSFSIACDTGRKNADGKSIADFVDIVCWNALAEAAGNGLNLGDKVFVSGRLNKRSYEAHDGQKRWVTEVVADFIGRDIGAKDKATFPKATSPKADAAKVFGGTDVFSTDEEIPF